MTNKYLLNFLMQCLLESISIVDILCSLSRSLIHVVLPVMRKLYTRFALAPVVNARLLLPLVKFFINHGKAVSVYCGTISKVILLSHDIPLQVILRCTIQRRPLVCSLGKSCQPSSTSESHNINYDHIVNFLNPSPHHPTPTPSPPPIHIPLKLQPGV